ncbi:uncharacterized protein LOC128261822 [Drosophila gunungcola]|uniref:Uncharacterized protein n=1 Tax=Drosophila gunungcola TaxID=103775 RepID=A0A9Q0BRE2_9MUSC|nr:uncharacterized protein LOC128261822 [Drosophila gunungcola]KAI8041942.1 hypothetical protein M5D96_003238 [Drosophila gunungcola]
MNRQTKEWSRARLCKPKDNLTTEAGNRERFVPSCELECTPISMARLIGWEYARIWLRDRDKFIQQRERAVKAKFIKNDFEWWLKLRKTPKKFCKVGA